MPQFNFAEFDESVETWSCYIERLKAYFLLHDVIDDQKKQAAIVSLMGAKTYGILRSIVIPRKPEQLTFDEIVTKIDEHVSPAPNKYIMRSEFRDITQAPDQCIQDYAAVLRKASLQCKWTENELSENLIEQFLRGLQNRDIKFQIARSSSDLEFDTVVSKAVSMLLAMDATKRLSDGHPTSVHYVNGSSKGKKKRPTKSNVQKSATDQHKKAISCSRCNGKKHNTEACKYPSDIECHKCGRKGHIRPACRSTSNVYHILNSRASENKPIMVRVKLNDNGFADMELDTGSAVSCMPLCRFVRHNPDIKLNLPDATLRVANGSLVKPAGMANVKVQVNGQTKILPLYLMSDEHFPMLFGRNWLSKLRLNWRQIRGLDAATPNIHAVVKVDKNEQFKTELKARYPLLFSNSIRKIVDQQGHVTLKANTTPVFLPYREPPIAIREGLEKEIERLVKADVLTQVEQSEWATPVVPVVKSNGDIRFCGDFKLTVNPHLIVDSHPIPKPESIFEKVSQGKHFARLDIREAFLHLEMDEESQRILTFNTHLGLFRMKRLPYGIASAPCIWQRTMERILSGIPGIVIFFDDIAISGSTEKELRDRIHMVLKRLEDKGLCVNLSKSQFSVNSIEYCG